MKKNLVDKVLLEWSYRCEDGIPDINNPKKLNILKEMLGIDSLKLKEQEIPFPVDYKGEIIDYIQSLDDKNLKVIYNKLDIFKQKEKFKESYKKELSKRNLESLSKDIFFIAYDNEEVNELLDYLKSPTITLTDFKNNDNIFSLAEKTLLSKNLIKDLLNKQGSLGVSIGRGEIVLVILLQNSKMYKGEEGDIQINDEILEIKASRLNGKLQSGAGMVSKKRSTRSNKKDITEFINNYSDVLDDSQKNILKTSTSPWLKKLKLLSTYLDKDKLEDFKNKFKKLLEDTYKDLKIENINVFFNDSGDEILAKEIAIALAKEYMETHKNVYFINVDSGNYLSVNSESIDSLIKNGTLSISSFTEDTPRIYYAGK